MRVELRGVELAVEAGGVQGLADDRHAGEIAAAVIQRRRGIGVVIARDLEDIAAARYEQAAIVGEQDVLGAGDRQQYGLFAAMVVDAQRRRIGRALADSRSAERRVG